MENLPVFFIKRRKHIVYVVKAAQLPIRKCNTSNENENSCYLIVDAPKLIKNG